MVSPPPTDQKLNFDPHALQITNQVLASLPSGYKLDTPTRTQVYQWVQELLGQGATPEQIQAEVQQRLSKPSAATAQTGQTQKGTPINPDTGQPFTPSEVMSRTFQALASDPPDPSQFQDMFEYTQAFDQWASSLQSVMDIRKGLAEFDYGAIPLGDGRFITQDDFNKLDPATQQRVSALAAQQNADITNKYNKLVNDFGLSEWQTQSAVDTANNQALSQNFRDQLAAQTQKIDIGKANQQTSLYQIDRALQGMTEARARAGFVEDSLASQQGWAVPDGKTSFTSAELGPSFSAIAEAMGQSPNVPMLNFTGTRTQDPGGLLNQFDTAMGVQGPIPQVRELPDFGPVPTPQNPTLTTGKPNFLPYAVPPQLPPLFSTARMPSTPQQMQAGAVPAGQTLSGVLGLPPF